ncbi:MAG: cupin domain-containing protein [Bacteroidales bacterium]|jgi:quercetin dioxygenase-like cupin family protein|nr:cupin domain-containing protein [Bacteroidales bacterium]NLM93042.1 cupin domain-containing protein [Bacteroidales bacterium]
MSIFDPGKTIDFKKAVDYSTDGIVSKQVLIKSTGNVTLFAFDQGQRLSEHSAPFDAMVQVLEGKGEVIINKEPFILEEGQTIIMPANIPHAVHAIGRFKMLLTMIKGS